MSECGDCFAYVADCFGTDMFEEEEEEPEVVAAPVESAPEELDEDAIPIQTLEL